MSCIRCNLILLLIVVVINHYNLFALLNTCPHIVTFQAPTVLPACHTVYCLGRCGELRNPFHTRSTVACEHASPATSATVPNCPTVSVQSHSPAFYPIGSLALAAWRFQYTADWIDADKVNDALALATGLARHRWRHGHRLSRDQFTTCRRKKMLPAPTKVDRKLSKSRWLQEVPLWCWLTFSLTVGLLQRHCIYFGRTLRHA